MRFDDTLETVLASDLSSDASRASAWRQLVDLIGRRRAPADPRAIATLGALRGEVTVGVRSASARAIEFADPPEALVELLACDDLSVAMPVLRGARMDADAWIGLLPRLAPSARSVLRNRRDLDPAVSRALDSFGATDLVLSDDRGDAIVPAAAAVLDDAPDDAEGAEAIGPIVPEPIPVEVAADASHPSAEPADAPTDSVPAFAMGGVGQGVFRIADVVARIEDFQRRGDELPRVPKPLMKSDGFRFETDATGLLHWVDGVAREALIGLSLDCAGGPGMSQVDGIAPGALRRRAAFRDARLRVAGTSEAGGEWLISGVPAFDPATGRFTGYRGTARRPRVDERAERPPVAAMPADQLRQLVHELRTPAGAIAGFAEMIETQMLGPVEPPYRERAATILGHARDLLAVIDDLDLAARIETDALDLRADAVSLAPLLATIARDLEPLATLRGAILEIAEGDAVVRGDRRAVERLLARLLATLVSASGEGEDLFVRMGAEDDGRVAIVLDRPAALARWPGDGVFDIDDEGEDGTLLGTGFALRLARNLAVELGGALVFGATSLTLHLPDAEDRRMGQARIH